MSDQTDIPRGTAFVDDTVRDIRYALRAIQARSSRRLHHRRLRWRSGSAWSPSRSRCSTRCCFASMRCRTCTRCSRWSGRARPTASASFHARAVRRAASRDQRLHRCLCGGVRSRQPPRRAFDVRHVRHGQLLPGAPRQRRDRARADACRRRASRGTTGDGPQSPRMGPAVCARPGHSRPPRARQWGHVRDRRRDARGISRTDRRTRRLLGAALDARSGSPDASRPRSGHRPRHHRTPEAGHVARRRHRQDSPSGIHASRTAVRSSAAASNITLVPRHGTVPQPLEAVLVFAPLFFAFGLILLIGCANVANLLLARARGATA